MKKFGRPDRIRRGRGRRASSRLRGNICVQIKRDQEHYHIVLTRRHSDNGSAPWGTQTYAPLGTAPEYTVVLASQRVPLSPAHRLSNRLVLDSGNYSLLRAASGVRTRRGRRCVCKARLSLSATAQCACAMHGRARDRDRPDQRQHGQPSREVRRSRAANGRHARNFR